MNIRVRFYAHVHRELLNIGTESCRDNWNIGVFSGNGEAETPETSLEPHIS
jgi:hypothetical protein